MKHLSALRAVALAILLMAASTGSAPGFSKEQIRLPEGFSIHLYAKNVPGARSMILSSGGTLFVGSRRAGNVYAIRDKDGDFVADEVIVIARNLRSPNGVALADGDLYVAEIGRILRFDDIEAHLKNPPEPTPVTDRYPDESSHGWKFIRFGPDGKLYVPVGAPCNICRIEDPFAAITRIDKDGSGFEIFARGIRNTVGFDWHPETGALWFTDNGRDWLGDNRPPDELNRAPKPGLHFGYPYFHGDSIPDPEYGDKGKPENFRPPARELGPHVAALGMRFYTGKMFPEKYRGGIFIAEHGSWNRSVPIGYRVTFVPVKESSALGYEVFAQGWLQENGQKTGRPVDVEILGDGSMLVSDDYAGAVYRITYSP